MNIVNIIYRILFGFLRIKNTCNGGFLLSLASLFIFENVILYIEFLLIL